MRNGCLLSPDRQLKQGGLRLRASSLIVSNDCSTWRERTGASGPTSPYLPMQTPYTQRRLQVGLSNQSVGLHANACMLSSPVSGTQRNRLTSVRGLPSHLGWTNVLPIRTSVLLFNVALHRLFRSETDGANRVRTTPHRRETRTQLSKLLTHYPRGLSFELVRQLNRCKSRRSRHKQMAVVRHDFPRLDLNLKHLRLFSEQLLQGVLNGSDTHGCSILGTPDKVIMQVEHRTRIVAIALCTHGRSLPQCYAVVNCLTGKPRPTSLKGAVFPLLAKAQQSPNRRFYDMIGCV